MGKKIDLMEAMALVAEERLALLQDLSRRQQRYGVNETDQRSVTSLCYQWHGKRREYLERVRMYFSGKLHLLPLGVYRILSDVEVLIRCARG